MCELAEFPQGGEKLNHARGKGCDPQDIAPGTCDSSVATEQVAGVAVSDWEDNGCHHDEEAHSGFGQWVTRPLEAHGYALSTVSIHRSRNEPFSSCPGGGER